MLLKPLWPAIISPNSVCCIASSAEALFIIISKAVIIFISAPQLIVRLHCGSKSMHKVFNFLITGMPANSANAVLVFETPPF